MTPAFWGPRHWRSFVARREARALIAVAVLLGIFAGLLFAIRGPLLPGFDFVVSRALQRERSGPLDTVWELLTIMGGFAIIAPLGCLLAVCLWQQRKPRTAILLAAAALIGHPISSVVKLLARRPRPVDGSGITVLMPASGSSFPSGHALATVFLFGFLAVLAATFLPRLRVRQFVVAECVLFCAGVGFSRVYVGGHYLSDVVGGWAVGLFLVVMWTELHRVWAGAEIPAR